MKLINAKSIVLLAVVFATAVAQAHVEPGSFLNKPAKTTQQLVNQTRNDKQVRDRYLRHFRMSDSELVDMFSHLRPSKLQEGGSFIVYNIHDDGVIRARVFILKKGTPVFVDDNGRPILKISCGNPMVAPKPKVALNVTPHVEVTPHVAPPPAPAPAEVETIIIAPPAPPVMAPERPAPPIIVPPAGGNVYNSVTKSSVFILPLLLFINNHGSCCECPPKQPVPEPASMLVMGFGASWMVIRKKRKNHAKV